MKRIVGFFLVVTFVVLLATNIVAKEPFKAEICVEKEDETSILLSVQITENSGICGGSFNLIYDPGKLCIADASVGELLSGTSCMINPNYKSDALRIVWASVGELSDEGELVNIKFDVLENASGNTEFLLDNLKLTDFNGERIECVNSYFTLELSEESSDTTIPEKPAPDKPHKKPTIGISDTISSSTDSKQPPSVDTSDEKQTESETEIEEDEENNEKFTRFDDVQENDWFYDSVKYVYASGVMNGVENNKFSPRTKVTRAMLVTILYRLSGSETDEKCTFSDVEASAWYHDGVAWAAGAGITKGIGNGLFAPNNPITREQIAQLFYNYAVWSGIEVTEKVSLASFADGDGVSVWATDAVKWAVGTGLIKGKNGNMLDPVGVATRAEIATVLMRFMEKTND